MAKIIQLPDGVRVNMDQVVDYSISGGSNVVLNKTDGTAVTYAASSADIAEYVLSEVDIAAKSGQVGLIAIGTAPWTLTSWAPTTFTSSTPDIRVYGRGFTPDMSTGKIYVEDVAGGADSNGHSWSVTYISPTELSLTFLSAGDATAGPTDLMYFQAASGLRSNQLAVSTFTP